MRTGFAGPLNPSPTVAGQRNARLDALRGLALCGVLLENMQHFVSPTYAAYLGWPQASGFDRALVWTLRFALENKIYLLFAFFFGYGMALQLARTAADGADPRRLHAWRMFVLALIGIVHSGIWSGDILLNYALLGFVVLPLRAGPVRLLLALSAAGMLLPSVLLVVRIALDPAAVPAGDASLYPIRQTSFAFSMFTAGIAAGRFGWLDGGLRRLRRRRGLALAIATIALAANTLFARYFDAQSAAPLSPTSLAVEALAALGTPSLALLYLLLADALWDRSRGQRALARFAPFGRTTLTHYLLQSLIGMGLLHRIGPDAPGPISPAAGCALAVVILALQIAASRWWLARHAHGPAEWFWRSLSYGRRLPLDPSA